VRNCLTDARCFDPVRVNNDVSVTVDRLPDTRPERDFIIIITVIVNNDPREIRVGVDTIGDRAPNDTERRAICAILQAQIGRDLRISTRIRTCSMDAVSNTKKRQTGAGGTQTTNHMLTMTTDAAVRSGATSVVVAGAALLAGLAALLL